MFIRIYSSGFQLFMRFMLGNRLGKVKTYSSTKRQGTYHLEYYLFYGNNALIH